MLTLRAAAKLLAQADSLSALRPLAEVLGFTGTPLPVNGTARREFALTGLITDAAVSRGPGTMRLLAATLPSHNDAQPDRYDANDGRALVRQLGAAIAREAPSRHWCLLTLDASASVLYLATVTAHPDGPRIAALRVDRNRVVDSDADTLRALAGITETRDALRHARFTDVLRRDALSARFYRALDVAVRRLADTAGGATPAPDRAELALLCASRCLFLAFLEAKGWLNDDRNFLIGHIASRLERGGQLHERLLRPLFFGTLNTPIGRRAAAAREFGSIPFLNGGLFSPTRLERKCSTLRFTDDAVVSLVGDLLDRYRFTAREDSTSWSEAAVDPEMLGRAFECLMASDDRRKSGAFYTPPQLVDQVLHDSLGVALHGLPSDLLAGGMTLGARSIVHSSDQCRSWRERIAELRVLDPACGSGAFLVHALERLSGLLQKVGDHREVHVIRREVLTRSLFGVDRNPMAVWLCELRLWLSVVIECPETRASDIPPLPNLDHNVRIGDTLAGGSFEFASRAARNVTVLRGRYSRATGVRKQQLAAALDREERTRALADASRREAAISQERRDLLDRLRARDLFGERTRRSAADGRHLRLLRARQRDMALLKRRLELGGALPFRFATHFADVAARGGFGLVIGNPPWVRPHAVPSTERERLRTEYRAIRNAAWQVGARRAGAGAGFAAQADLSVAFVERSAQLLAADGTMALLLPAKLWRSLAGGGIRQLLGEQTRLRVVRDWSDAPSQFDATTYPSLVVAQRSHEVRDGTGEVRVVVSHRDGSREFSVPIASITLDDDRSSPWVLLPEQVRSAFDALRHAGPALGDSSLGRPMLGVKCGCNAAFVVRVVDQGDEFATIESEGRTGIVERHMLRPVLRGEDMARIARRPPQPINDHAGSGIPADSCGQYAIVWTHGIGGAPLSMLPPRAARWLAAWRPRLEARGDARARTPWWALFRTEAAAAGSPRVVWADMSKRLSTVMLSPADCSVPLNTCYVIRTAAECDALALHALLSSPVVNAWLDVLAEPARGGFRRYLGWTVATLPIPRDWAHARVALASVGRRMAFGECISPAESLRITSAAYGLDEQAVSALVDWNVA